ncbi:hypothetical protein ABK040_000605 [Willaertia magna]
MGYLYASKITNNTPQEVSIGCIYEEDNGHYKEEVSHVLLPYKSHTFGPKTSAESRMHIQQIDVSDSNKRVKQFMGPFVQKSKEKVDFNLHIPFDDFELASTAGGGRTTHEEKPMPQHKVLNW